MDTIQQLKWSPFSEGYLDDPYKLLKACRESEPIQKVLFGDWIFFRHEDVSRILAADDFVTSKLSRYLEEKEDIIFKGSSQCPHLAQMSSNWMVYQDGEEHRQVRVHAGRALNTPELAQIVERAVVKANAKFEGEKSFNLVDYTTYFVFLVVKEFLGLKDVYTQEEMVEYALSVTKCQDVVNSRKDYLRINEVFSRSAHKMMDSGFVRRMAEDAEKNGNKLADEQLMSQAAFVLMAAYVTTRDAFSISLLEILRNRHLIDYIEAASRSQINILTEEILRFTTPLQYTIRYNLNPISIYGFDIPVRTKIYLSLASANRDEEVFPNGDQIIPDRKDNPHVAFSKGAHHCLGGQMARTEFRTALKPMFEFLKGYKLSDASIEWAKVYIVRSAKKIMLEKA